MVFKDDFDILFDDFGESATVTDKTGQTRTIVLLLDADMHDTTEGGFNMRMRTITATIPSSQAIKYGELITVYDKSYDVISIDAGINGIDKATLRQKS